MAWICPCGKSNGDERQSCAACGNSPFRNRGQAAPPPIQYPYPPPPSYYPPPAPSGRKTWRIAALSSVALAAFAWMYISPYLALRDLKDAASEGNTDALREAVDFPSFRTSVKEELNGQISASAVQQIGKDGAAFAFLGSALVGSVANALIDEMVTPQTVATVVRGKKLDGLPAGLSGFVDQFASRSGAEGDESKDVTSGYESFDRFYVRISPEKGNMSVTFLWFRSGLVNWRLSALRLSNSQGLTKETSETSSATPMERSGGKADVAPDQRSTTDVGFRRSCTESLNASYSKATGGTLPSEALANDFCECALSEFKETGSTGPFPDCNRRFFGPQPDRANGTNVQAGCLPYAVPVKLGGTIAQQTFPGRPNYESVAKGDEPETVWILNLDAPICTLRGNDVDEPAENNAGKLQLVFDQAGMYDTYRSLLGKPVTVTGNLGFGITAHYHTTVALWVRNIEP